MKKPVVNGRLEPPALSQLHEIHNRIQSDISEGFDGAGRDGDPDERVDELVELDPKPRPVHRFRVLLLVGGFRRGGGRDLGEEGDEEGLEGDEGFEGEVERGGGGDEGEEDGEVIDVGPRREELVAEGFQVL